MMVGTFQVTWASVATVPTKPYRCGFCHRDVSSERGYTTSNPTFGVWICPSCNRPTFFGIDERVPDEKRASAPFRRAGRGLSEWAAHLLVVAGLLVGFRLVELLISRLWPVADRHLFGVLRLSYIFDVADLAVLAGLLTYGVWCVIAAYRNP
jgi:ribosomal protein L37AE/L43A